MADVADLLQQGFRLVEPITGEAPTVLVPGFDGQYQAAENWCWAAAAAAVEACYVAQGKCQTARWQCQIVDQQFPSGSTACNCGVRGGACSRYDEANVHGALIDPDKDKQGFLNEALRESGMLEVSVVLNTDKEAPIHWVKGLGFPPDGLAISDRLDFDEIKALIRLGRPVCLRIVRPGWRHFIVLYGYEGYPDNDIVVWDPARGEAVMDFDDLAMQYGPFTHKLITRPPAVAGPGGGVGVGDLATGGA